MNSNSEHWDNIFSKTENAKLGWYEKDTSQTFKLLDDIPDWEKATVFLPGAGTSILIEDLIPRVSKLILNDISIEALNRVRQRLNEGAEKIDWLCIDIAQPIKEPMPEVDIWIDRAVLHFLTNENDIKGYFENLKSILKIGGHAVFAEFSLIGAPKCAGLTLHRYSIDELSTNLGSSFKIVSHFDYTYINPFGDPRPYIYALFKREK
ncbi:MAG TPA: class I SAM-dependent methyltransferase [Thermodesulfobacteriota bacterium]|nr:class I SAM-dependent methyltransferase [Thermodesulfobacteriota bacterium]